MADAELQRPLTDEELLSMRNEFRALVDRFDKHEAEEKQKYDKLLTMQSENAAAINRLADATHEVVEAWKAAQGALKVGALLGRFMKWLTSLAVIGGAVTWAVQHVTK